MRPLEFKLVEDLRAFFPNEDLRSDRGGSIVAFAYLEECVTDAIKTRFVNTGRTADDLLKVGAPLGDANAKIKLAYVMNICSKETMQDIVHLAWVRNRFAHWHVPVDFAHADIRGRIESLTTNARFWNGKVDDPPKPYDRNACRWVFITSIEMICFRLYGLKEGAPPF